MKTLVTWSSLNGDCEKNSGANAGDENVDEDDEGVDDDKKLI